MNYHLWLTISFFVNFLCFISSAIFLRLIKKSPTINTFCLYSLTIGFWSYFSVFLLNAKSAEEALFWNKLLITFVFFTPSTFLHFVHKITCSQKLTQIKIAYSFSVLFSILNFFNLIVNNIVTKHGILYYPEATFGYTLFIAFLIITTIKSLSVLYLAFRNTTDIQKRIQYLYLFIFSGLGHLGAFLNFNIVYNLPPTNITHIGNFTVTFYYLVLVYTIIKHKLFDISIAVEKSFVYTLLIVTLTITYLLSVITTEHYFREYVGYNSFLFSLLISLIIAIIFIPLRNLIQNIADKIFYTGSFPKIAEQNILMRQELTKADKYKSLATLASGIAHEIKNPLGTIKTFAEYLPRKSHDKEFLKTFGRLVNVEVDRIDGLVHQLLDYGKPASPQKEMVIITQLVDETLNSLNLHMVKQHINLIKKYKISPTVRIFIDPQQIKQVFLNIFLNAIEAMPQGGMLTVTLEALNNHLVISVKDTGCGIPPEKISQIFDPFFSTKDNGTGLGLAITQGIIEEHGGKISVKSTVGEGTEFKMEMTLNNG